MKKMFTLYLIMLTITSIFGLYSQNAVANQFSSGSATVQSGAKILGETYVCNGETVFTYTTEPSMINYQWMVSDGGMIIGSVTTNTLTVVWKIPGAQTVAVQYEDPATTDPPQVGTIPVFVTTTPDNPGIITGPTRLCQGESEAEYSVPPIAWATNYTWLLPTGATIVTGMNTNTIKVSFSMSATSGGVVVYGSNMCGDGNLSPNYIVAVHEIPSPPAIKLVGNVLHSNATDGNQWYCDGVALPGETRQALDVTQNGRYWCIVSRGGCVSSESNKIDIDLSITGVNDLSESGFQIYPVPNNGQFVIKAKEISENSGLKIQIYNNLGMIVFEKNEIQWDGNASLNMDLSTVPSGTYAVVIHNDKVHVMKKMLIKK
jgi:hypothetical protein